MSDAIGFSLQLFSSFINTIFGYCNFTYNGFTVNIGWFAISSLIFSILIRSLLNLPVKSVTSEDLAEHVGGQVGGFAQHKSFEQVAWKL